MSPRLWGTMTQWETLFLVEGSQMFLRDKQEKHLHTNCPSCQRVWDFSNANPNFTVNCYFQFWRHKCGNHGSFLPASFILLPWVPSLLRVLPYGCIFYCGQPCTCLSCKVHQSLRRQGKLNNKQQMKGRGGEKFSVFGRTHLATGMFFSNSQQDSL